MKSIVVMNFVFLILITASVIYPHDARAQGQATHAAGRLSADDAKFLKRPGSANEIHQRMK